MKITQKKHLVVLCFIVLAGAGLRLYRLDYQSLWNDELFTWKCSASERWNEDGHIAWERGLGRSLEKTIDTAIYDIHPPGYLVLMYYVTKYFGDSEFVLRFPSALFGTITIIVIYLLGVRLYSHREGLIAASLMSFLWCPIYFSQEARTYSMLLCSTLASVYFWMNILKELNKTGTISKILVVIGYIVASSISCWLHYFGTYFILLQAVTTYLLFIRRIGCLLRLTLALHLPIFLVFLPWIPVMLMHFQLKAPTYANPTATAFFKYIKFCFNESIFFFILVSLMYALLFYRFYKGAKPKKDMKLFLTPEVFLLLWLIVPFIGAYLKSISGTGSVYQNKNLIISLPAAYLLLARAITTLPFSWRKQIGFAVLLLSCFLGHLVFVMDYYSKPVKQQFREGVQYIIDHHKMGEKTFIIGNAWDKDYYNYYFEKKGSPLRATFNPIYLFFQPGGLQKATAEVLKRLDDTELKHVWFISSFDPPPQPFVDFLNQHLILDDYKKFIHILVWHYIKPPI